MRQRWIGVLAFVIGALVSHALGAQSGVTPFAQIGLRASDGAMSVTNVGDCGTLGPITAAANLGVRASNGALQVCGAGGGGGGAPTDATYVTQTPNGSLSAAQALSLLSSGLMRVATTTGAITAITDSAGLAANISNETGTGALVFGTAPTFTTGITTPRTNFTDGTSAASNANGFSIQTPNSGLDLGHQGGDPAGSFYLWSDDVGDLFTAGTLTLESDDDIAFVTPGPEMRLLEAGTVEFTFVTGLSINGSSGHTGTTCTSFTMGICTAGTFENPIAMIRALQAEVEALRAELAAMRARQ